MTESLVLRPLAVSDATVMTTVLADPSLYEYTGGEPPSLSELEDQYKFQTRGQSPDGAEQWINLVVLREPGDDPIGYVQATVEKATSIAEISWVIGRAWQRQGYASRAAQQLVELLMEQGVQQIVAHIHPDHAASQAIARKLGLVPTEQVVDGEIRWERDVNLSEERHLSS
ncbi:GNAT family N-acetyltransferase [Micrococcoides hystricis]|uniref:GNAT family N-acetyltransferase n=1 Tax=Micrococcoides hystricis TaxID=1572761 RepID=A0ABV6P7A3_9MICC